MRVQVNLSEDLVSRIDKYAQMVGMSRSSLCAFFVGQGVMSYDKSLEVLQSAGLRVADSVLAQKDE